MSEDSSKNKIDRKELLKNIKCIWQYLKYDKFSLIVYTLDAIIEMIISVFIPLISAKLILSVTDGVINQIILTSGVILLLELFSRFLSYFKGYFYQKIHMNVMNHVQVDFAREVLKLEIKEIDKSSTGVFIDRLNNDTDEISGVFMEISYWITNTISKIGIMFTIFLINKYIFCYFCIVALISFKIQKINIERQNIKRKKYKEYHEKQTSITGELVRGIRDIKVLNAQNITLEKTKEQIYTVTKERFQLNNVNRIFTLIGSAIGDFSTFIFLVIGCILVNKNLLTIPNFVILYNYKSNVFNLFTGVNNLMDYLKQFSLASSRIFEVILEDKFSKEKFGVKHLKKITGNFSFENVTFGYNEKEIIKDMSFNVNANETVAFVGKSGSGKTTIFNLLTKLYNIDKGSILIDGVNIKDLDEDSIRNNMSIITQNPYIFNFSIKENLLLANPKASMKEIKKACKLACLDDYIESLENKYDTVLGEGGLILSGGQKQRLAIARALLMKTEIILFDEATSALDNETQEKIKQAINNMKGEYTILIIAHRLSTIVDSDKIFVIDDGKVVESGTHKELLKKSKKYKELYQKDLKTKN